MWFTARPDRPRRVYYSQRIGLWIPPIVAYFSLDEFRAGDEWHEGRDRLSAIVQQEFLQDSARYAVGQISLHTVWASIIPSVYPSHWITVGWRSSAIDRQKEKAPVIQIPVSIGPTDEAIRDVCGPIFFAIDALPAPESLDLSNRDRAVLSITMLSALSIAIRERMKRS